MSNNNVETRSRPVVPGKQLITNYPLIDNDPHFKRVITYARPSDWAKAVGVAAAGPALLLWWERISPSFVGKGGFAPIMRLTGTMSMAAAFLFVYNESQYRFYGSKENRREIEMDMREMVDKVKQGKPLYGVSTVSEHIQGVAARNSRWSGAFMHLMPWFNFVNHSQHGVDTAKYYQQAERELEAERTATK